VEPLLRRPENAMTRPSPSTVVVAYHRPSAIPFVWTKPDVTGSKIEERLSPVNE
jgi:hypothetical protein